MHIRVFHKLLYTIMYVCMYGRRGPYGRLLHRPDRGTALLLWGPVEAPHGLRRCTGRLRGARHRGCVDMTDYYTLELSSHSYIYIIHTYILTGIHVYTLYILTYIHIYIYAYIHTYIHTYILYILTGILYIYTYIHTYIHFVHTYLLTVHTYRHTYIHTCIYIHTHTYLYIPTYIIYTYIPIQFCTTVSVLAHLKNVCMYVYVCM